ncbi:hypothetical protein D9756_000988 [Leucocoprinus leucothites]|uniref:Thioredoxin domain-containing protein n=1 Tax=Leucocoprinus leucothites TaxID=201217 RepID=A0A8H5GEQ8_9AGAR|nr:hypothetical protein D9756_000988 [Leucoagaricus leucothites]
MRVLKALTELPLSFVLTTLAVVSSATGTQLQQLTPSNFKEYTEKGLWFVEHSTPYCIFCRRFAPTWKKLVGDCEREIPSVRLAQVDCSVHGDLCNANGIRGYPTMTMFNDGERVGDYYGNRGLEDLKGFIKRHVRAKEEQKVLVVEVAE